jgi:preprotein translocase subunit SecA
MGLFTKIFGTYSERELKQIYPIADKVEALEEKYKAMSDEELKEMTPILKKRLADGETLNDILPDAFAVCREASARVLNMRHFHVQIIGGIVLHQGRIAEMKTGEGKTLVATLPAYLNALTGKGVHIVTVNDYLAKRDSEWMGKLYRFLGLEVGLIVHDMTHEEKQKAYNADITYGTNNELGFDYLRDNMVIYKENKVARGYNFAIVDEVDSILIDEARTPLIISGRGEKSTDLYERANNLVSKFKCIKMKEVDAKEEHDDLDCDYIVDEKAKTATLTKRGVEKAEAFFGIDNLADPENNTIAHHVNQAIKAHGVMQRDIEYVVRDGQVIIVDEFTGRLMFGRRYNEGLHQAIEAKEGVKVENENRTLATITFQNFFRLYGKLSGMTGTAKTEETEFQQIYSLDVIEIPTNKPVVREDHPDVVYRSEAGKFRAVVEEIARAHEKGQPVLVGTISIEKSEQLSKLLKRTGIKHEVLNAKYHEKEASIISQAGKKGAVTIATNMAGRGTDIMLGGNAEYMAKAELIKNGVEEEILNEAIGFADTDNEEILDARTKYNDLYNKYKAEIAPEAEEVKKAGGLYIIGTERHESRRIDNQLRGRSGRQGDPGESRFFLSTEDDLMRLFGGDRMGMVMETLTGSDDDMPINNRIISNSIESAQKKIEGRNFSIRKNVLEYDDVMNRQREMIYEQRNMVLDGGNIKDKIVKMIYDCIDAQVDFATSSDIPDEWDLFYLREYFYPWLTTKDDFKYSNEELAKISPEDIKNMLKERADKSYADREERFGEETMRELERVILLSVVDRNWMDHIDAMDELKNGIYLRGYGQHDPVVEYRNESYDMFNQMTDTIREETAKGVLTVEIKKEEDVQRKKVAEPTTESAGPKTPVKREKKVGRNDPCPCGSGKKYKKCCGAND